MNFDLGVGAIVLPQGSNEGGKCEDDIYEFAKAHNIEVIEIFTDTLKSPVTDTNIEGIKSAVQVVASNKNCVLITSTMREIEENLACVTYLIKTKPPLLSTDETDGDVVFTSKLLERAEKMIIHRREKHAQSVKRGQERARRYNRNIGSKNFAETAKMGNQAQHNSAAEFRRKILPILREIRNDNNGVVTYEDYKRGLESRNVLTRTGNKTWQRSQIRKMIKQGEK